MFAVRSTISRFPSSSYEPSNRQIARSLLSTSASRSSSARIPFPPPLPHPIFNSRSRNPKTRLTLLPASSSSAKSSSSEVGEKDLSDEDFNRLTPLDQIRSALFRPRPAAFRRLDSSILDAAFSISSAGKQVDQDSKPEGFPFCSLKQLALYGDRIWGEVTTGVLLAMRSRDSELNKAISAGSLSGDNHLLTNSLAVKLVGRVGLKSFYKLENASEERLADTWEAYLAALYLEKGRQELLNFLAPIMKAEHQRLINLQQCKRITAASNKLIYDHTLKATDPHFHAPPILLGAPSKLSLLEKARKALSERISQWFTSSTLSTVLFGPPADAAKAARVPMPQEEERLRIHGLPKLKPLLFPSLAAAKIDFRKTLEKQNVPYYLYFSPTMGRAYLQLPGAPLIAVKTGGKLKSREERILTKMVQKAVGLGYFQISEQTSTAASKEVKLNEAPGERPALSLDSQPLRFATLKHAKADLFKQLSTRKVMFDVKKNGKAKKEFVLYLPGYPPIVARGQSKSERRRIYIEEAMKLGIVKLEA